MTEESLHKSGVYESLKVTQDKGVFEFCGMEVQDHVYIPELTSLSEEEKKNALDQLIERVFEREKV